MCEWAFRQLSIIVVPEPFIPTMKTGLLDITGCLYTNSLRSIGRINALFDNVQLPFTADALLKFGVIRMQSEAAGTKSNRSYCT
jgi:hypothetical protein